MTVKHPKFSIGFFTVYLNNSLASKICWRYLSLFQEADSHLAKQKKSSHLRIHKIEAKQQVKADGQFPETDNFLHI